MKKSFFIITALLAYLVTGCNTDVKLISDTRAKAIALSHAAQDSDSVTFVKCEVDTEDGKKVYEIEFFTKDNTEYTYTIDAVDGNVISFETETKPYKPNE